MYLTPFTKRTSILLGILLPPLAFYWLLSRSITALPFADDYDSILRYLVLWKHESLRLRLVQILTYQHNDYRCMVENAVVGFQYSLLGHANLTALCIIGNLLVVPVFGALYLIWRERGRQRTYSALAFVPVSWLVFQLQYEGTVNFATSGLQCIPVVLFALLTCVFATKPGRLAFAAALSSFVLCVGSYANGLFLIPIGILVYLQRKEYRKLAGWCLTSMIAVIVYFHNYDFTVEQSTVHLNNNVLGILQHVSPVYAAAFLGSTAAVRDPIPAIVIGVLFAGVFIAATLERLYIHRPAFYFSSMFFIITALAASGLRSQFGVVQALDSRYRINATVVLVLLYLYAADKCNEFRVTRTVVITGRGAMAVLLVAFNVTSNYTGSRFLVARRAAIVVGVSNWEQHQTARPSGPAFLAQYPAEAQRFMTHWTSGLYDPNGAVLTEAIRDGVYTIPPAVKARVVDAYDLGWIRRDRGAE